MRAHSRTAGVASRATTRMRAPVSSRPSIFCSPTLPAPTTSTWRPSSLMNIGNKLVTDTSWRLHDGVSWNWQIARHCLYRLPGKKLTQLCVAVPNEKATQIFARLPLREELSKQSLQSIWNFRSRAAISNRTRRRLMQPKRSANAEVIGIDESVLNLDFLSFNTDVGDPMLPAAIGASRNMQLQVLIESRQPVFEFFY